MKVPVIVLLCIILVLGIVFTNGEVTFLNQIVAELRF